MTHCDRRLQNLCFQLLSSDTAVIISGFRRRSMRALEVRLFGAHGNCLSLRITSLAGSPGRSTCKTQHRAKSGVYTTCQTKLLERTSPNPAKSHYGEKPIYPHIPLRGFVPATPLSERDLASTRPAKLETPQPLKQADYNGPITSSDRARWLYRLGRAYLSFYKTGLSNVWQNYKELRKIQARIGDCKLEDVVKYGSTSTGDGKVESVPIITRKDYQIALRTRHDLGKLIPFSIVFAICGSFTPLVIAAIGSGAVPYTCRIPRQEQIDFLRPVKIQPKYMARVEKLRAGVPQDDANMRWKQEFLEAYRLHANPFSLPIPVLGKLWHHLYSGPRLRRHCEEVLCDTILIWREDGFDKLSPREVFQWSLKYGLNTLREYMHDRRREGVSIDPDSSELKETLLPVVEAEAKYILDQDWTRLRPENHWLASLRPIDTSKPLRADDKHLRER